MTDKYNKHLTKHDRDSIEGMITKSDCSLKLIASVIQKSTSTVSKEVKLHRVYSPPLDFDGHVRNYCHHADNCYEKNLCGLSFSECDNYCKRCSMDCKTLCKKFNPKRCGKLNSFPWVCNGCSKRHSCKMPKYFYYSRIAHQEYIEKLSSSRMGVNLTPDELASLSTIVANCVKQGQPISHIVLSDVLNVPRTQRSLYNYIEKGYIADTKNIDLRRKVGYKRRKPDKRTLVRKIKDNRNISDFQEFISNNPDANCVVQMDTVLGLRREPKCLLTLHFVDCHFMIARL